MAKNNTNSAVISTLLQGQIPAIETLLDSSATKLYSIKPFGDRQKFTV